MVTSATSNGHHTKLRNRKPITEATRSHAVKFTDAAKQNRSEDLSHWSERVPVNWIYNFYLFALRIINRVYRGATTRWRGEHEHWPPEVGRVVVDDTSTSPGRGWLHLVRREDGRTDDKRRVSFGKLTDLCTRKELSADSNEKDCPETGWNTRAWSYVVDLVGCRSAAAIGDYLSTRPHNSKIRMRIASDIFQNARTRRAGTFGERDQSAKKYLRPRGRWESESGVVRRPPVQRS